MNLCSVETIFHLSRAYLLTNNPEHHFQEILELCNHALPLFPKDGRLHYILGCLKQKWIPHNFHEAQKHLETALQLSPHLLPLFVNDITRAFLRQFNMHSDPHKPDNPSFVNQLGLVMKSLVVIKTQSPSDCVQYIRSLLIKTLLYIDEAVCNYSFYGEAMEEWISQLPEEELGGQIYGYFSRLAARQVEIALDENPTYLDEVCF